MAMKWQLRGRSYHSPPYSLVPVIHGWDVWLVGVKRIGAAITTQRAAKALAELHASGEKRVGA